MEGKALQTSDGLGERGEGSHKTAVGGSFEVVSRAFRGNRQCEGMKFLAVLDVLVHILHHVFGKGRSEQAAIAESAVAEFRAALAPGDNFVAEEEASGLADEFFFARQVSIGDFAIVKDSFDFLGIRVHAEGKSGKRGTRGMTCSLFEREISGAESRAGIPGDGLDIDAVKTTAQFERTDEQNIQKQAPRQAKRTRGSSFAEIHCELNDDFFDIVLRAAGNIGTPCGSGRKAARGESEFPIELGREETATIRSGNVIATIQSDAAVGLPHKQFAKNRQELRLAIFAEPLNFVFVAQRAQPGEFGDARVEPAQRVGEFQGKKRLQFIAVAKRDKASLRADALIKGQNQGPIEAGRVVGAGSVTKMMIEVGGAGATAEELVKMFLCRGPDMAFAAGAGGRRNPIGKPNGTDFRKFQMILKKAAIESQTRDFGVVLQTREFFLFDSEQYASIVQESHGGTPA